MQVLAFVLRNLSSLRYATQGANRTYLNCQELERAAVDAGLGAKEALQGVVGLARVGGPPVEHNLPAHGSSLWRGKCGHDQCYGTVTIFTLPVPVQTYEKLWFRSCSISRSSKENLKKKIGKNLAFLHSKLFYKEKL
jgi:hypothetical protein